MARYDGFADWYDENFAYLGQPEGSGGELSRLVGPSHGAACLDVGCGTGLHFRALEDAGYSVIGCDISADQLRRARTRCRRVVQADGACLPFASGSLMLVVATFIHTDVDDWAGVVREVARVLCPGGRFVSYGLHPCFVGHFSSDRTDANTVLLVEGYGERELKYRGTGANVLRPKVGSRHVPLDAYLQAFVDAGLTLRRFKELGYAVVPGELAVESQKAA